MRKIFFLFILTFCVFGQRVKEGEDEFKLGDECESLEDCESITNAVCNAQDSCECIEGFVAAANNSVCLPLAKKIGDKCDVLKQCSSIPSAQCLNSTCVLAPATTISPMSTKPKEECTEDSHCLTFLVKRVCKNGTCVMALPNISPKTLGVDTLILGKSCANDTECLAGGTACIDSLCKCTENFVPAQNLKMCLPKAKAVGDKCTETVQCLGLNDSICENGKCSQTISKFFSNKSEKIPSILIGSTCQTDNECKHLTHALCLENVCQCKDNYITSVTSNSCLEKARKEGDPCEIDKQCEDIKGATCVQNKCVVPGVVGTKLGKTNSGSTQTVSTLMLGAILFNKAFFV